MNDDELKGKLFVGTRRFVYVGKKRDFGELKRAFGPLPRGVTLLEAMHMLRVRYLLVKQIVADALAKLHVGSA